MPKTTPAAARKAPPKTTRAKTPAPAPTPTPPPVPDASDARVRGLELVIDDAPATTPAIVVDSTPPVLQAVELDATPPVVVADPAPAPTVAIVVTTPAAPAIRVPYGDRDVSTLTAGQKAARTRALRLAGQSGIATVAAGTVSPVAKRRVLDDAAALTALGYDVEGAGTLLFEAGRRVVETGDQNLIRGRDAWENLPLAHDAIDAFARRIAREGRRDVRAIPLAGLEWETGATLNLPGVGTVRATPHTAAMIGGYLAPGLRTYLPIAPFDAKRAIHAAHRAELEAAGTKVSAGIRTSRRGEPLAVPEVYRIASDWYLPMEPETVCGAIVDSLPKSWRATVRYDGSRWELEASDHADTVVDLATGDMFACGVRFSGDDVVRGSLRVTGFARRNLCQNLIIIGEADKPYLNKIHVGKSAVNVDELRNLLATTAAQAAADLSRFTDRWGEARRERVIDETSGRGPAQVFGALVDAGLVDLPGKRDDVVGALLNAWGAEPGYSHADVVNAITRAAHDGAWWQNLETSVAAESQAAQVLNVRNLAATVDRTIAASAVEY